MGKRRLLVAKSWLLSIVIKENDFFWILVKDIFMKMKMSIIDLCALRILRKETAPRTVRELQDSIQEKMPDVSPIETKAAILRLIANNEAELTPDLRIQIVNYSF